MPDTNLVQGVTYLMDCFIDDFRVENPPEISDLDLRAQVEVNILIIIKIFSFFYFSASSFVLHYL